MKNKAQIKNESHPSRTATDSYNNKFVFSTTSTHLLTLIAKGEIDSKQLAREELGNRGVDKNGRWVGFKKSAMLMGLMMLIVATMHGQARIGFTEREIISDGTFSSFDFSKDVTTDGMEYLQMEGRTYTVLYYFREGRCAICAVVPKNQTALSGIVEVYNSTLVRVNATRWMEYLSGGILECDLMQTDKGLQYFRWRRYEQ